MGVFNVQRCKSKHLSAVFMFTKSNITNLYIGSGESEKIHLYIRFHHPPEYAFTSTKPCMYFSLSPSPLIKNVSLNVSLSPPQYYFGLLLIERLLE